MRWLALFVVFSFSLSAQDLPAPPAIGIGTRLDPFLFMAKDFQGTVTALGGLMDVDLDMDWENFPEGFLTDAKCTIRYDAERYHESGFKNLHNGFEVDLPKGAEVTYRCWGILRKHIPMWRQTHWICPQGLRLIGSNTLILIPPKCINPQVKP